MKRTAAFLAAVMAAPACFAATPDDASGLCGQAIAAVEHVSPLPPNLLGAIGLIESGRTTTRTAWPWTINIAGNGHFFDSKEAAIDAVQTAQRAGIQSIDVGCMQINLFHHPKAFSDLGQAFEPLENVRYAAVFLQQLHGATGSWTAAAMAYHSSSPGEGAAYGARLATLWPIDRSYLVRGTASPASRLPATPVIDPYNVFTPEFRAQLAEAAADRRNRDARLGQASALSSMVARDERRFPRPHGMSEASARPWPALGASMLRTAWRLPAAN